MRELEVHGLVHACMWSQTIIVLFHIIRLCSCKLMSNTLLWCLKYQPIDTSFQDHKVWVLQEQLKLNWNEHVEKRWHWTQLFFSAWVERGVLLILKLFCTLHHCLCRCVFASNFPVDRINGTFPELISALEPILEPYSLEEKKKFFAGNAKKFYRL